MATTCIEGPAAFDALAAEWDTLARRGMTDTPFQTLAYQQSWWTNLHPQSGQLFTFAARDDQGALQGIASLYHHENALHFNGCVEETDYLDLIATADDAPEVWAGVLDAIAAAELPAWQTIDLCNIPAASATRAALPAAAVAQGYQVAEQVMEVCPVITLPGTFDDYLESLDSKQRREISRKLRRAEAAGVTTTVVGPEDDVHAAVATFLDLLQRSTFEKRDWLNDGRRAVFHEVAEAAQAAGTLQLMFLDVDGDRAAGLFNFDYNGRIWVYNSGLDPTQYSALSLGVVLTAAAIQKAIEDGRQTFDFLRGDEEYKYRFGAEDTQVYRLTLTRP
jgi:CelD/BcsL family acetyltransferase involved in cellulose biosynthesis